MICGWRKQPKIRFRSRSPRTTRSRGAGGRTSTPSTRLRARAVDHRADRPRVRRAIASDWNCRAPVPDLRATGRSHTCRWPSGLKRLHQGPRCAPAILRETPTATDDPLFFRPRTTTRCFCSAIPPITSSRRKIRWAARARRQRAGSRKELAYEAMLSDAGPRHALCAVFWNYATAIWMHPRDAGPTPIRCRASQTAARIAGIICDASFPTYLLTHWTRDRSRGEKLVDPLFRGWRRSRARPRCRSGSTTGA